MDVHILDYIFGVSRNWSTHTRDSLSQGQQNHQKLARFGYVVVKKMKFKLGFFLSAPRGGEE